MVITNTNISAMPPILHLNVQFQSLLESALSQSIRTIYKYSWKLLQEFVSVNSCLLSNSVTISNFIGHLFAKSYSPSTITSHVSAFSYINKVLNIDVQSNSFIVQKMLKNCDNARSTCSDSRLPITKSILKHMLTGLESCIVDVSLQLLFKSCVSLSLFCLSTFR